MECQGKGEKVLSRIKIKICVLSHGIIYQKGTVFLGWEDMTFLEEEILLSAHTREPQLVGISNTREGQNHTVA